MEQFETIKILAEGLHACGVSVNCAMCIVFLLETEEQAQSMLDWILELKDIPTEQDCLRQAEIIKRTSKA